MVVWLYGWVVGWLGEKQYSDINFLKQLNLKPFNHSIPANNFKTRINLQPHSIYSNDKSAIVSR